MKTLLSTLVMTAALTGTAAAAAADKPVDGFAVKQAKFTTVHYNDDRRAKKIGKRHYDKHHNGKQYKDRRYDDQRYYDRGKQHRNGNVRLDIPVHFRGDGRLKLKQLVRQYHGVNADDYRLVRVVVDSHGRRDGAARLRVGQRVSDLAYLGNGRTVLQAPNSRANGRWILKLDDARVSNVRVVMEPRYRAAKYDKRYDKKYDRGSDKKRDRFVSAWHW